MKLEEKAYKQKSTHKAERHIFDIFEAIYFFIQILE